MTRSRYILIATLGSVLLLGGAYAFQHLAGYAPCKMCLWQRWPHGAAILIGVLAIATDRRELIVLGMLAALATSGIGLYHAGVEQLWWEGPNSCTSSSNAGLSSKELLDKIMAAPVVRCDEIAWSLLGLSMAAWNAILSFICACFWFRAFVQK